MKEKIVNLLASRIPALSVSEIDQYLEIPPKTDMGDYAFPCFKLAKAYRKAPAVIAQELAAEIGEQDFLESVNPLGPYVNFFVNKSAYAEMVMDKYTESADYGASSEGNGQTICIDYSSPNVAKNFHVGHLRTTIIGNSLYKIFTKLSYKVERINHLGDWGTQFGKLIVAYKKWGSREAVESRGIEELMEIYVRFHKEADEDPSLEDQARAAFTELENGNKEYEELWKWFVDISLKEFLRIYDILGMSFDHFTGESFYRDQTSTVVEMLKERGLLTESEGALVVMLDEYDMPPCIVAKKDGSSIYATRDLAAILYRKKSYDFSKCLYVTGLEQKLHFAQIFKVIELMGYDYASNLVHIPYGLVSLKGGKLSTRNGNVIYAEDLLNEAIAKTRSIIEEKGSGIEDKDKVAHDVGVGAILFNDLYNQRIKDVVFDWEKLLNFDGETGPYVQYTYARASSVLRKIGIDGDAAASRLKEMTDFSKLTDEYSLALLKVIEKYPSVIKEAASRYEPSMVARYSMDLAHAFNAFYRECQINVPDEALRNSRTSLVVMSRSIIRDSLALLGINCPEAM
ncbi:MAG: arginine--tRNA ligase [Lachnospiraceae bacterium]|nr:arginine--tRNA ligase [Lachnospiraceae bacterium]